MDNPEANTWRIEFVVDEPPEGGHHHDFHRPRWRIRGTASTPDGAQTSLEEEADQPLELIPHAVAAVADLLVRRQQALDTQVE